MDQPTRIDLKPLKDGDLGDGSIFPLYSSLLREHIEKAFGWDQEFQKARVQRAYPPECTSVIRHQGLRTGVLVLTPLADSMHVSLLLVETPFQRRGIGTAVMSKVCADAAARKLPVTLSCFRSNKAALDFYRALGFLVVKQDEHFVDFRKPYWKRRRM